MNRRLALGTAALVLLTAVPAAAHVTVNPREANKGSYAKLAFRVPNERPEAGTVKLEVQFPQGHPFRSVSVKPVVGWGITITKADLDEPLVSEDGEETTEFVSLITWEAQRGVRVNPGEFQEFEVSVGPTPEDVDELLFKAIQTYDNDEVVRWIDEPEPGSDEEPEHPAAVLSLIDAPDAAGEAAAEETSNEDAKELRTALVALKEAENDVDAARGIAIGAMVVAALALLIGLRAMTRKSAGSPG